MQRFDENYLARREEQIRKTHERRALLRMLLALAVAFTVGGFGSLGFNLACVSAILLLPALGMWMGVGVIYVLNQANRAAEREIQREREQILAMAQMMGEKPKRTEVRLSDDGELVSSDETEPDSARKTDKRVR